MVFSAMLDLKIKLYQYFVIQLLNWAHLHPDFVLPAMQTFLNFLKTSDFDWSVNQIYYGYASLNNLPSSLHFLSASIHDY